ncbi:hypothetical protein NE476_31595, partial [Enterocloster bolteae]|nr:hypothetical protein [Enterocloster bolteae]
SNAGTSNPLQQIASGVDLTIFGGHMVEGCMPALVPPSVIHGHIGHSVFIANQERNSGPPAWTEKEGLGAEKSSAETEKNGTGTEKPEASADQGDG